MNVVAYGNKSSKVKTRSKKGVTSTAMQNLVRKTIQYKGTQLNIDPEIYEDFFKVLRVLADRERDITKVNTRTFKRFDLVQDRNIHMPLSRINEIFNKLSELGICTFKKGKSGLFEKAEFKEPARVVARRMLGLADSEVVPAKQFSGGIANDTMDTVKSVIMSNDINADAKVAMLKLLLKLG